MNIANQFDLPLPPAAAWAALMNVPETAACFPGASDIVQTGPDQYTGKVTVKLGPLTMVFAGRMQVESRDDAAHSATIKATWSETRGRGHALTVTQFCLSELNAEATATRAGLNTDLQLAGQVAQYGRASGMLAALSQQLVADFAKRLHARLSGAVPEAPLPISALGVAAKALLRRN